MDLYGSNVKKGVVFKLKDVRETLPNTEEIIRMKAKQEDLTDIVHELTGRPILARATTIVDEEKKEC